MEAGQAASVGANPSSYRAILLRVAQPLRATTKLTSSRTAQRAAKTTRNIKPGEISSHYTPNEGPARKSCKTCSERLAGEAPASKQNEMFRHWTVPVSRANQRKTQRIRLDLRTLDSLMSTIDPT